MMVYISSSWKMREAVRALADRMREAGIKPYDFTDPRCRNTPEIPPESFPDLFDHQRHIYSEYIQSVSHWRKAMEENRAALDRCDAVVLLLPCGNDAHADWAYAVGKGKRTCVLGAPLDGDRSLTHMWADALFEKWPEVIAWLKGIPR